MESTINYPTSVALMPENIAGMQIHKWSSKGYSNVACGVRIYEQRKFDGDVKMKASDAKLFTYNVKADEPMMNIMRHLGAMALTYEFKNAPLVDKPPPAELWHTGATRLIDKDGPDGRMVSMVLGTAAPGRIVTISSARVATKEDPRDKYSFSLWVPDTPGFVLNPVAREIVLKLGPMVNNIASGFFSFKTDVKLGDMKYLSDHKFVFSYNVAVMIANSYMCLRLHVNKVSLQAFPVIDALASHPAVIAFTAQHKAEAERAIEAQRSMQAVNNTIRQLNLPTADEVAYSEMCSEVSREMPI